MHANATQCPKDGTQNVITVKKKREVTSQEAGQKKEKEKGRAEKRKRDRHAIKHASELRYEGCIKRHCSL